MFQFLSWAILAAIAIAIWYAYAGSRDVFHPLMFLGPMMIFMYVWMPLKLDAIGGLDGFFQRDQLNFVQGLNLSGVLCFLLGCLSQGCRLPARRAEPEFDGAVMTMAGAVVGLIGLAAWAYTIANVGGFTEAFGKSYAGGWDDNGYIRDASLLMFPAFLLILAPGTRCGFGVVKIALLALFLAPWTVQAAFTARRGPTFMIAMIAALGWYLNRRKRPPLALMAVAGGGLGFLMLFLVANRGAIYLGSDKDLTTDVGNMVEKPDTGNEFIYGTGTVLSAEQRNSFYWGRRYLAQVIVRPIPHTIWPTKYEDFGLPELNHNAGTGEGFEETLGWSGAEGSAPGMIADLWVEFWWLNLPALFLTGMFYAYAWRRANIDGGPWVAQYVILSALSIYFVMQTMEAVIFRLLILSLPVRLAWRAASKEPRAAGYPFPRRMVSAEE